MVLDSSNGLYVADYGNNRVLFYPSNSTTATKVYGQSGSFTTNLDNNGGAVSATTLNRPAYVTLDSTGALYVADGGNNRVLYYPSNSTTAIRVYGQNGSFTTVGAGIGPGSMDVPSGLAVDSSDNLYVADSGNNRVSYFVGNAIIPTKTYTAAILGTSNLSVPTGVAVDNSGLYILDTGNSRILFYPNGSDYATVVYGQPDFTTNSINNDPNQTGDLNKPTNISLDKSGNLLVADPLNNRVITLPLDPNLSYTTWADALSVTLTPQSATIGTATASQFIVKPDGSKWFKITAPPESRITLKLSGATADSNLPGNYDLALYRDIKATYNKISGPNDLTATSAQAAPYEFLPYEFLPYEFLPSDNMAEARPPFALLTDLNAPLNYQPESYSAAVERSILSVSALEGVAPEYIFNNTNADYGTFYIRVKSTKGTSNVNPFRLDVKVESNACSTVTGVNDTIPATAPTAGQYRTVFVTDFSRMTGTAQDKSQLQSKLAVLASRPEVNGIVLDLSNPTYQRIAAANTQADNNKDCSFAKNIVASEVKRVVDSYRQPGASTQLQYVVVLGPDSVIPFVRYADKAGLAPESDYKVPVVSNGAAAAALKSNKFLSQDAYGSKRVLDLSGYEMPVPDLAVGRLVETAPEISNVIQAYLDANGQVSPKTALVTGYDFVSDAATAVKSDLQTALPNGTTVDSLIQPGGLPSSNPSAWTADNLRTKLLANRYDMVFLAGHFSSGYTEAADATTSMGAYELLASNVDMRNTIFYSVGCHSGYNISQADSTNSILSEEPDWAQVLARKGAVGIFGTGYQYGDSELIEYSERLHLEFTKQMHTRPPSGTGNLVTVGQALARAKQHYLGSTVPVNGMHQKVMLETTLYGLPMLALNLKLTNPPSDAPVVGNPAPVTSGPGQNLGLAVTNYTLNTNLITKTRTITNSSTTTPYPGTYFQGSDGYSSNTIDPIFPLELRNVTNANGVARGVGFRGGSFTDLANIFPLTSSPATEFSRSRATFGSPVLYPTKNWTLNYGEAINGGSTRLAVIPAQYQSSSPTSDTGTLRKYSSMNLRLFYSNNTGGASQATAPEIISSSAIVTGNQITFSVNVTGTINSGVQEVWITYYYAVGSIGSWQSIDLAPANPDRSLWKAVYTIPNGSIYQNLRFMVQAANGVGLVSLLSNGGNYYTPAPSAPPTTPVNTALVIDVAPSSAGYSDQPTFRAHFADPNTNNPVAVAGQVVNLEMGGQRVKVVSDANGQIRVNDGPGTATIKLRMSPDSYTLRISYPGNAQYNPIAISTPITITKLATSLSLTGPTTNPVQFSDPTGLVATLKDNNNQPLGLKQVTFVAINGPTTYATTILTDFSGKATLGRVSWPLGTYNVSVYFSGNIPTVGSFSDSFYLPSTIAGPSLTLNTESSSINNLGPTVVLDNSPMVTARVLQQSDGTPGNLELAQVTFTVFNNAGNQVIQTVIGTTNGNGVASAALANLTPGNYKLQASVSGNYFISPASSQVDLTVEQANCLQVTLATAGTNACNDLKHAIDLANGLYSTQPITLTFAPGLNINVTALLPQINNQYGVPIVLDGGGNRTTVGVTLNANPSASPPITVGLSLGNNVTVKGFKISGFNTGVAIDVQGSNNVIAGNILGRANLGESPANANLIGIRIGTAGTPGVSANDNQLGLPGDPNSGNLISGNSGQGIQVNKGLVNYANYNWIGYASDNATPLKNVGGNIKTTPGGQIVFRSGNRVHG